MKRSILSVTLHHDIDSDPDTSYLGEYSNTPDSLAAIDRQERGDWGRGVYRYFNPAMTAIETGNPDSPEQAYRRLEAFNRGDWCYLGIYAVAEVQFSNAGPIQEIRSGGLWGIESDSDRPYLESVANEELYQLRAELTAAGFTKRELDKAFRTIKHGLTRARLAPHRSLTATGRPAPSW